MRMQIGCIFDAYWHKEGIPMIKILIVEDEKPIADLIDCNLSAMGYQC